MYRDAYGISVSAPCCPAPGAAAHGLRDAPAGSLEIVPLALDADEFAAHLHAGDAGGAGAHERIEDGQRIVRQLADAPFHHLDRFLGRVIAARLVVLAQEAAPAIADAPDRLGQIGPGQLAIGEGTSARELFVQQRRNWPGPRGS